MAIVAATTLQAQQQARRPSRTPDPTLVGRLDLEKYKATIKGLTQFGDRRQGTERNRKATDWIEAQLKSYGCPTERLKYDNPAPPTKGGGGGGGGGQKPQNPIIASGEVRSGPGGSRYRGITRRTGVNNDPNAQPDEKLRELNREPTTPGRASRSTAPRSAPPGPTRCTSSARTWTDTAGARPRTTTDRGRRW